MDFDWGHHHVIYHGWNRPGWVNRVRPYVHVRDVYINQSRPSINQTWRHDRSHGDPARYLASRPSGPNSAQHIRAGEIRGQTTVLTRSAGGTFSPGGDTRAYSNRGRESRGIVSQQPAPVTSAVNRRPSIPAPSVQRPAIPSPNIGERRVVPSPSVTQRPTIPAAPVITQRAAPVAPQASSSPPSQPAPAREGLQPGRTPSVTFGGYRGADEARAQSNRGEASRQSTERMHPSAPPASQGRSPAGGNSAGERQQRGR
jgi:hypothetical protein